MLHRIARIVLFMLIALLLAATVVAFWARQEIYSEETYLDSITPLASDSSVQQAIVDRIVFVATDAFSGNPDLDAATQEELIQLVRDSANLVVASPEFTLLWIEMNQAAHPLIKQVLTGAESDELKTAGGTIQVNVTDVYRQVEQLVLENTGIDLEQYVQAGTEDLWIPLFSNSRVRLAQDGVSILNRALLFAPILILTLAAVFVWMARNRLQGILQLGGAILLAAILQFALVVSGGVILVGKTATATEEKAALAVLDTTTSSLQFWYGLQALFGITCLVALFFVRRREREA